MAADRHRRPRNVDAEDWTTDFPTHVLAEIFSLLPHRSALRLCSINYPLSAAFQEHLHRLARAAALDFGEEFAQGMPTDQYLSFVDRILHFHEPYPLDSLKIFFRAESHLHLRIVLDWLKIAASKNARVLDLDLGMRVPHHPRRFPSRLEAYGSVEYSTWSSLTVLSVSRYYSKRFLFPPKLPSLQMLSMNEVYMESRDLNELLLGCPMLSAVKLLNCSLLKNLKFSKLRHLRSLTIIDCKNLLSVVIEELPVLKSIYSYGPDQDIYKLKDVPNLTDAYLSSVGQAGVCSNDNLSGFNNVTNLTFCDARLQKYDIRLKFSNVKNLHLIFGEEGYLKSLYKLLCWRKFPILENLFIEVSAPVVYLKHLDLTIIEFYAYVCPLWLLQFVDKKWQCKFGPKKPTLMNCTFACDSLRLVSIRGFGWCTDHVEMAQFFVAKAPILETLVLIMSDEETGRRSKNEIAAWMMGIMALTGRAVNIQVLGALDPIAISSPPNAEFHSEICHYLQCNSDGTHGP